MCMSDPQTPTAVEPVRRVTAAEAITLNPALNPDYIAAAIYEPAAENIDGGQGTR